ncbi:helix-turn-helix domain-containing protein [Alteribacillus sp. YIM 98480]|uniref:helix-turn-helix domain-containing protein n=1 Tax=Alteribacillus sp. YIM 98480 TaxID=2606599 RepID=UPI00131B667D
MCTCLIHPKKDHSKLELAFRMHDSKEYSIQEILDATGISRATFYRYLSKWLIL